MLNDDNMQEAQPVASGPQQFDLDAAATAEKALKRIGELYAIEEAIRGFPATERLAARQSRSNALLISLHNWLVEKSATLSKNPS